MKKYKILMIALFLFALGCDEDGGSSVTGSEEVGAPSEWPED